MIQSTYATSLILTAGIYAIFYGARFIHDRAKDIALNQRSTSSSMASLMMFLMLLVFVIGPFVHFFITYLPVFLPKLQLIFPKAMLERNFLNSVFVAILFYFVFQALKGYRKGRRLKRHGQSFVKDYQSP